VKNLKHLIVAGVSIGILGSIIYLFHNYKSEATLDPVPDLKWVKVTPLTENVAPFRVMDTEVTIAQYLSFLDLTGNSDAPWAKTHRTIDQRHPATGLSVAEMRKFAFWLTRALRNSGFIAEMDELRLPTDNEFSEMVQIDSSRESGSSPSERYKLSTDALLITGEGGPPKHTMGNVLRKGDLLQPGQTTEIGIGEPGDGFMGLAPVRSFPDGRINGVYDLLGNAAEVLEDAFDGKNACARGGSFLSGKIELLRRAYRGIPSIPGDDIGFRLVIVRKATRVVNAPIGNNPKPIIANTQESSGSWFGIDPSSLDRDR